MFVLVGEGDCVGRALCWRGGRKKETVRGKETKNMRVRERERERERETGREEMVLVIR